MRRRKQRQTDRQRTRRRAQWGSVAGGILAVVLVTILTSVGPPPAGAQAGGPEGRLAGVSVAVDGRWPGRWVPGRDLPLVVEVTSERALRGTVTVDVADRFTIAQQVEVPIEVPARGTATITVVLPATSDPWGDPMVMGGPLVDDLGQPLQEGSSIVGIEATVRSGDRVAVDRVDLDHDPGDEAVAVLADLAAGADLPERLVLRGTGGRADVIVLTDSDLTHGAAALSVYGTILASPADLSELSTPQAGTLTAWVARGGHLIVEADDAARMDAVAPLLRPPVDGPAPVGGGTVRRATGLSGGGLDGVIDPSGASWNRVDWSMGPRGDVVGGGDGWNDFGEWSDPSVPAAMVGPAGLRRGGLDLVMWLATAYVILVGPVLFFALRRRGRRTLGWVAVPALALGATAAIVVAGEWRWSGAHPVQVSVVLVPSLPDGTTADAALVSSAVLAPRTAGPSVEVATDGPATLGTQPLGDFRSVTFRDEGDRLVARPSLDPGTAAAATVEQVVAIGTTPRIRVLHGPDGELVAEVTNDLDIPIHEAVLVQPHGQADVGELAPGAQVRVPLEQVEADQVEEPFNGVSCDGCRFEAPIATTVEHLLGTAMREPGTVTLVAVTDGVTAPLRVSGDPVTTGVTAWVVPVAAVEPGTEVPAGNDGPTVVGADSCPRPDAASLTSPAAVPTRASIAVAAGADEEGPGAGDAAVVRFDLVGGWADATRGARLVVPGALETAQVFDGTSWQPVGPGCPLPPGATDTGTVLVRTRTSVPGIGPDPGVFDGMGARMGGGSQGWTAPYRELGIVAPWTESP